MTPKQEAFARAYVETGNASEAYRRAYKAKGWKQEAIAVNACKVLKNAKVQLMVDQLKQKAIERTLVTVESLTEELNAALSKAMDDPKGASAAVAAVVAKGKLHGHFVDRSENVNHNYSISDQPADESGWTDEYATEH